jgi:ubiquinone/menaquinone biosynthesis C-methylase UbiE
MDEVSQIVRCPQCGGEMASNGQDICCDCGYSFEFKDGFFRKANCADAGYARFYTRDYFNSTLYDYSKYRLCRLLGLALPDKGMRILDLGCGPGEIAIKCAMMGAEVYGVDVSRDALTLCSERCKKGNVIVHLFEFDGQRVPFMDAVFDSIILSDVAEHVDDRTLSVLLKECARLLAPDGRLVIHTSPTKNIIGLSRLLKNITLGRVNLLDRLVNPDYEFLHVRYHSPGSLRNILTRSGLYPISWGEFEYLSGTKVHHWAEYLGMRNLMADQLWCLVFKNPEKLREIYHYKPYLNMQKLSSYVDLGSCDELLINYGFYGPELNSYRWMGRRASLFVKVPENASRIAIKLNTCNPDAVLRPVSVSIYLAEKKVMNLRLQNKETIEASAMIKADQKAGVAELRLEVDKTFVPLEKGMNEDGRELGVAVQWIEIS